MASMMGRKCEVVRLWSGATALYRVAIVDSARDRLPSLALAARANGDVVFIHNHIE